MQICNYITAKYHVWQRIFFLTWGAFSLRQTRAASDSLSEYILKRLKRSRLHETAELAGADVWLRSCWLPYNTSMRAPLFPFQLLLQGRLWLNELHTHFIMMSDIMELTSTISEQASASGAKHLREDKLITTLWAKPRPFHRVQGPRLNPALCPPRCLHPRESEVRWTSSLVLNAGLLKRHLGSLGRRGSSTNLFVVGLVGKGYRLHRRLLPASGWVHGSVSLWTVKQRGISLTQVLMITPDAPKGRKDSRGASSMTYRPFPAV